MAAGISKTTHALPATAITNNPTLTEARTEWDPAGGAVALNNTDVLSLIIPPYQALVGAGTTQTLFAVADATFGVSTLSDFGSIECRRMR
jgi:hypothetical protein